MEKLELPKSDRRSGVDRRCFNYTNHVPERRSGEERRGLEAAGYQDSPNLSEPPEIRT